MTDILFFFLSNHRRLPWCFDRHVVSSTKWSHSLVSNFLWLHGLYSPWNSPGQNTGVGSLPLLRGSSQSRNWTGVSCIVGRLFSNWAIRVALWLSIQLTKSLTYNFFFSLFFFFLPLIMLRFILWYFHCYCCFFGLGGVIILFHLDNCSLSKLCAILIPSYSILIVLLDFMLIINLVLYVLNLYLDNSWTS